MKPYLRYPTLLDSAFSILRRRKNVPQSLRSEVLRTLGILGAPDPYWYEQIQLHLRAKQLEAGAVTAGVTAGAGNSRGNSSSAFKRSS